MRGWRALLIALPFALVLAWSQRTRGPSRAELAPLLARAEGRVVVPSDIQSLQCTDRPAGVLLCKWRQRSEGRDGGWQARTARLGTNEAGWRLLTTVNADEADRAAD